MSFSPELKQALLLHAESGPRAVHQKQVELARLLIEHGPPQARQQLELAEAFLSGKASAAELKSAQQDCWTHVGSLACGCSPAESASGAAFLSCLDAEPAAHTPQALSEQVERTLRAGGSEQAVLAVLASGQ